MEQERRTRRRLYSWLGALALVAAGGSGVPLSGGHLLPTLGSGSLAASTKADFSLSASPTSVSAQQRQVASYTISETKQNGFNSAVTLSVTGLPAGSSATFSPQTLDTKTTSTMTVAVGASTPATSYDLTVTGTGGGLTHPVTVTLVVTPAPQPSFTLGASPSSATLLPGGTAAYSVSTTAVNSFTGTIALSVTGVPAGGTATFTPGSVAVGGSSSLQLATKSTTTAGTYSLTVTGTSGTQTATVGVTMVITSTGKQFTITAPSVTLPGPGTGRPLNLALTNPNSQPLQVTNLTVAITSVSKAAGVAGSCTPADYVVVQYSGAYPLTIPAGGTVSLSALVTDSARWPQLTMLNAASNQDGCKGATLALAFSGAGQG